MQYIVSFLAISCVLLVRAENAEHWKSYYKSTLNMRCKEPQERALLITEFKDQLVSMISDLELEKVSGNFEIYWYFNNNRNILVATAIRDCEEM